MKISRKFWEEIGFRMSEFYSGKHKSVVFETKPLDFRRFPLFRHVPYWTAQEVTFQTIIKSSEGKKLLSSVPVFFTIKGSRFQAISIIEDENCVLTEDGGRVTITTEGLRGATVLEYYLGSPNTATGGATLIAELQGNWRDKKWFIVYGLVGGLFGSLIVFALGLAFEFIKINPFWEATLVP